MDRDSKFCPVFLFEIYFSIGWKDGFINRYDVSNNLLLLVRDQVGTWKAC